MKLHNQDLLWCVRRLHPAVADLLKMYPCRIFVAGGYIRAMVAGEQASDVDLFCSSADDADRFARELAGEKHRVHRTENALTVLGFGLPVQFIHRWTFRSPADCLASFDFTIARAAFWWDVDDVAASWRSMVDPDFYADLAAKRLVYRSPIRNEDAGGSLLRVLKFYQRGYRIPLDSLGAVIARLTMGMEGIEDMKEGRRAYVLTGLLREVDPEIDPDHIAHLPSTQESFR